MVRVQFKGSFTCQKLFSCIFLTKQNFGNVSTSGAHKAGTLDTSCRTSSKKLAALHLLDLIALFFKKTLNTYRSANAIFDIAMGLQNLIVLWTEVDFEHFVFVLESVDGLRGLGHAVRGFMQTASQHTHKDHSKAQENLQN